LRQAYATGRINQISIPSTRRRRGRAAGAGCEAARTYTEARARRLTHAGRLLTHNRTTRQREYGNWSGFLGTQECHGCVHQRSKQSSERATRTGRGRPTRDFSEALRSAGAAAAPGSEAQAIAARTQAPHSFPEALFGFSLRRLRNHKAPVGECACTYFASTERDHQALTTARPERCKVAAARARTERSSHHHRPLLLCCVGTSTHRVSARTLHTSPAPLTGAVFQAKSGSDRSQRVNPMRLPSRLSRYLAASGVTNHYCRITPGPHSLHGTGDTASYTPQRLSPGRSLV